MNLSFLAARILPEDLASRNRLLASSISAFVMEFLPLILAIKLAGVSNCAPYLEVIKYMLNKCFHVQHLLKITNLKVVSEAISLKADNASGSMVRPSV